MTVDGTGNLDPDLVKAIEAAVEKLRAEQTALLQKMVQTSSQTGDEGAVQTVVAEAFRAAGLDTEVWEPENSVLAPYAEHVTAVPDYHGRPNVTGIQRGAGDGRSLILNAHIDTVEIGDRSQWTVDPLGGEIQGDRLYGRGALDMKGGLVTNLYALRALNKAGYAPLGDVQLQSVISEEDGGAGALAAVLRGPKADAAIISEPTGRQIVSAHGGSLMFRIHLTGLSAHGAARDEGQSTIESWAIVHRGLLDLEARRNARIKHPLYERLTNKIPISVGVLRAGSWPSSVPEWLVAEGRAGLMPDETLEEFKVEFRDAVEETAREDPWLRDHPPVVEWMDGQFASSETPMDAPLVTTLSTAHEATNGETPPIIGVTYGADMRHFIRVGDMPCVMYGAGDVITAHAPDEWISLDEIARATVTLAAMIALWCGVKPNTNPGD